MQDELFALQDALNHLDVRRRGKGYPQHLKAHIIKYARLRRHSGVTWATLSDYLGIPKPTLSKWLKPEQSNPLPTSDTFMPVVIASEDNHPLVCLVAPNGWRIEGHTVDRALALLRTCSEPL